MTNELQIFNNPEFGTIRTLTIDNKTLFCANDVAKALGYARPADAISAHCKGSVKHRVLTNGGPQLMTFIPESDLYRLTFKSKLPAAEKFTDWVTEQVLPSIRKNGGYIAGQEEMTPSEIMAKAVLLAQKTIADRDARIAALTEENNQKAEILFKNGSYIKVVTANDSSRGSRATVLVCDEYRLLSKDVIDLILKKFLNIVRHPGYLNKPEYEHMAERNKEFYLSSAWFQNHWSYEKCKDYFVNMIDQNKKYYCVSFPYQMSIKSGLLLKEAIEDEMSESSFSDLTFAMENECKWLGATEGGLFQFDDINKTRVIEKAFYAPNIVLSSAAAEIPKKKNGEVRILTADIALMSSKKNDNDATSIFLNCMIPNKSGRYTSNFVYSENVEGMSIQDQALKLRRYFEYFNCDYLGIDARSVGIPLIDLLMRDIYDPETGETYPAISCCNNTEIADRCSDKAAKKVIWAIMGSSQFNSDVAIGLRSGFQQGRIHLLQSEYSCEDQLRKLYKGYDKMSPSERAALQMPYINTGLAVNELVNLGYETVNNVIKVKEKSGCRKDRYSSLSYNYYIAQQVERSMEKRHNKPKLLDFNFRAPVLKKGGL